MRRLLIGGTASFILGLCACLAFAQTSPKIVRIDPPKHILFVGNSFVYYNNGLPDHLARLIVSADKASRGQYTFKSLTISGAYLSDHIDGVAPVLKSRKWDVVVLQGQSAEPLEADQQRSERFKSSVRQLDKAIRDAGAKPVLFMTWAYQDRPEMSQPLAEGYIKIANELDALVVPVGVAFDCAAKGRSDLVLHDKDKRHPSLAGTYLAARVFYSALLGKSPAPNEYTADLPKEVAAFLQEVAWETTKAFYRHR